MTRQANSEQPNPIWMPTMPTALLPRITCSPMLEKRRRAARRELVGSAATPPAGISVSRHRDIDKGDYRRTLSTRTLCNRHSALLSTGGLLHQHIEHFPLVR